MGVVGLENCISNQLTKDKWFKKQSYCAHNVIVLKRLWKVLKTCHKNPLQIQAKNPSIDQFDNCTKKDSSFWILKALFALQGGSELKNLCIGLKK